MANNEHSGPVFEAIDKIIQGFQKIRSMPKAMFFMARYTEVKTGLVEAISKSVDLFRIQGSMDVSPVHEFLDNHLSIYNMQKKRISDLEQMRAEEIAEADRTLMNDKDYIEHYVEHFDHFRAQTLINDSIRIQSQVKETWMLWNDAEAKRKHNEADAKKKASNAKKKRNKKTKNKNKQEEAKAEVKQGEEEEEDELEKEEKKEKLDDDSVILTDTVEIEDGHVKVMFSFQFKSAETIDNTTFFNGEIQYTNSAVAEHVSFVPVTDEEEAKLILLKTMSVIDDRLLHPHFYIYCEKLRRHLVCYDHFDGFLLGWSLSEEQKKIDEYGAPSS